MPNWCQNTFTVSHEDAAMITKFAETVRAGTLFETFVPLSSGEWDYSTAVDEWGTKWDITAGDVNIESDGKTCTGWFETAWGPGINAYEKLSDLGFDIDITYLETGMCFAGRFTSPDEDYCVEYNFEDENWRDKIDDDEVLEMLESEYESWKEWQEEEAE
jgi:hypothetical protein